MKADWQHTFLHQHNNLSFMKLDRRGPDTPVIERYDIQPEAPWLGQAILILCGMIIGWAVTGLYQGWL